LRKRVISFIDGFNLYHAIDNLNEPHLKWLDLRKLSQEFLHPQEKELVQVLNFSTIATHRNQAAQIRQRTYLQALKVRSVTTILGQFKKKERNCSKCLSRHLGHEEKETDVNIALSLSNKAKITSFHMENCLLPQIVHDASNLISVKRPKEYDPAQAFII